MNRSYLSYRRSYYLLFALAFGILWYVFKLGGIPKPGLALLSTSVDLFFSMLALIVTVEVLLPRLIYKKAYGSFFCFFILVVLITGSSIIILQLRLFGYGLYDYEKNMNRYKEHFYYWFWSDLILGSYFLIAFISLGGIAIRLTFDRLATARAMEQLEKDKSQATLEVLKNQISPHFLFNALNTIYYKIDRDNASARSMVEMFSSLLRYQLYECNEAEVDIQKELGSLANYMELQKERANKPLRVIVEGGKLAKGFRIAPFILMPIVENCFKHVSQSAASDNFIKINYDLDDDGWFHFESTNTTVSEPQNNKGIGLANVKKRLNLIYPGRHSLDTVGKDGIFNLNLKIHVA